MAKRHVFFVGSSSVELVAISVIGALGLNASEVLMVETRDYKSSREYDTTVLPASWRHNYLRPGFSKRNEFRSRYEAFLGIFSKWNCQNVTWYFPHALESYVTLLVNSGMGSKFSIIEEGKSQYLYGPSQTSQNRNGSGLRQIIKTLSARLRYFLHFGRNFQYIPPAFVSPYAEHYFAYHHKAFPGVDPTRLRVLDFKTTLEKLFPDTIQSDEKLLILPLDKLGWLSSDGQAAYFDILNSCVTRLNLSEFQSVIVKIHPEDAAITPEKFMGKIDLPASLEPKFLGRKEKIEKWMLSNPNSTVVTGVTSVFIYAAFLNIKVISIAVPMVQQKIVKTLKVADEYLELIDIFGAQKFEI